MISRYADLTQCSGAVAGQSDGGDQLEWAEVDGAGLCSHLQSEQCDLSTCQMPIRTCRSQSDRHHLHPISTGEQALSVDSTVEEGSQYPRITISPILERAGARSGRFYHRMNIQPAQQYTREPSMVGCNDVNIMGRPQLSVSYGGAGSCHTESDLLHRCRTNAGK